MPKLLFARPPQDATEERQVHKLATSRHAPADWISHAKMITLSWQGLRTRAIAVELACHQQTVRERLLAFNTCGIDGLGNRPGAGRKRRISEPERSTLVALVALLPPGRLVLQPDGSLGPQDEAHEEEPAHWTLNALTQAAQQHGIQIKRSQVRRILLAEGVPWRQTHSWAKSTDRNFGPKGPPSSRSPPTHPGRPSARTNLGRYPHGCMPHHRAGLPMDTAFRRPWSTVGRTEKVWFYGALLVRDGHALTLSAPARNTVGYLRLLKAIERDNPTGDVYLIADNLSSHKSPPIQAWLTEHPRVQQVFIPTKACWLNLVEGWWRLFRREALAGQDFCGAADLDVARRAATAQLNRKAKPWVWGRPPPKHRKLRRKLVYRL